MKIMISLWNLLAVGAGETDHFRQPEKRTFEHAFLYCTAPIRDDDIYYITVTARDDDYLQTFMVPGSELPMHIRTILKIICVENF